MRERWIVALCVLYFVVLLVGALLVIQTVPVLGTLIGEQNSGAIPFHIAPTPQPTHITMKYVPVFHQDNQLYQGAYKPYIVTSNVTAQDYRSSLSCSLHISGWVNNTGDGTAYNALLHVVAMNHEGKAIDNFYSFAGITAHMSLGIGCSFNYTGSPIVNCTVTPVYTDLVHAYPSLP